MDLYIYASSPVLTALFMSKKGTAFFTGLIRTCASGKRFALCEKRPKFIKVRYRSETEAQLPTRLKFMKRT